MRTLPATNPLSIISCIHFQKPVTVSQVHWPLCLSITSVAVYMQPPMRWPKLHAAANWCGSKTFSPIIAFLWSSLTCYDLLKFAPPILSKCEKYTFYHWWVVLRMTRSFFLYTCASQLRLFNFTLWRRAWYSIISTISPVNQQTLEEATTPIFTKLVDYGD